MARARHRRWIAIAVVPLIAILGLESAWAAYACRMDGQVRNHCCCPAAHRADAAAASTAASLDSRCCCDITIHAVGDAPSAREASRVDLGHFDLALVPATLVIAATVHVTRIVSVPAFARPPPRVALYLDKHALLR